METPLSLPVEARYPMYYVIFAPDGGLHGAVTQLRELPGASLDLIVGRAATRRKLRVFANREEIVDDGISPSVVHFTHAVAVYLDRDGQEAEDQFNCDLYINTEVTAKETPCGELRLWTSSL